MAITKNPPNTIWLGPGTRMITIVNDVPAGATILPGTLVARVAGEYVAHPDSGGYSRSFALDQPELNKDCDEAYADGDLMVVGVGTAGDSMWAWLASGQNVTDGADLMSNGAGMFTASTQIDRTIAKALEAKNATSGDARIRIELV